MEDVREEGDGGTSQSEPGSVERGGHEDAVAHEEKAVGRHEARVRGVLHEDLRLAAAGHGRDGDLRDPLGRDREQDRLPSRQNARQPVRLALRVGHATRHAAARGHLPEAVLVAAEDDHVVVPPARAEEVSRRGHERARRGQPAGSELGDLHDRAAGKRRLADLALREERDPLAVRREEGRGGARRSRDIRCPSRGERPKVETRVLSAASREDDALAVGREREGLQVGTLEGGRRTQSLGGRDGHVEPHDVRGAWGARAQRERPRSGRARGRNRPGEKERERTSCSLSPRSSPSLRPTVGPAPRSFLRRVIGRRSSRRRPRSIPRCPGAHRRCLAVSAVRRASGTF